jgi:parvulin-like peptidyl-prolyl isomerase
VPTLVTTSYGLHVIVVEEVLPPLKLRFEEHEREIREQLSNERRAKVLDALIAELREKDSVKLDEASVRKALSDDRLLGELR